MTAPLLVVLAVAGCGGGGGGGGAGPERDGDLDRRLLAAAYDNDVAEARRLIEQGADGS